MAKKYDFFDEPTDAAPDEASPKQKGKLTGSDAAAGASDASSELTKPRGPTTKQLKQLKEEIESSLNLFNTRLSALEQRLNQTAPAQNLVDDEKLKLLLEIPRDGVLSLVELAERIYHISIPQKKKNKTTGKVTEYYSKTGTMVNLVTHIRAWLGKPTTYPWQKKPEA